MICSPRYGLAASVWTQSLDTMQALTRGIKSGTVWVRGPAMEQRAEI